MFLQRSCPVRPALLGAVSFLPGSSLSWGGNFQVRSPIPVCFGLFCPAQPCSSPARLGTGQILNRDTNPRWSETWTKTLFALVGSAQLASAWLGSALLSSAPAPTPAQPGTSPPASRAEPAEAGRNRAETGRAAEPGRNEAPTLNCDNPRVGGPQLSALPHMYRLSNGWRPTPPPRFQRPGSN